MRQPAMPAPVARDENAGKHAPGAMPAYLQRRKAEWAAEASAEALQGVEAAIAEAPRLLEEPQLHV